MLYIATVHFQSDEWIRAQVASIRRFAPGAELWASLDGIDSTFEHEFDRVLHLDDLPLGDVPPSVVGREDIYRHGLKLNELARQIAAVAAPGDDLLFLDGDALLLAPVVSVAATPEPLVAVRRDENHGDRFPHPSYCLTTVGFWGELGGDWRMGATWVNARGREVTDTGGRLLVDLDEQGVDWRPLTRCNTTDLHPLWFGVYGDEELGPVVYHHGAGFRDRTSRIDPHPTRDILRLRSKVWSTRQQRLDAKVKEWITADPEGWIEGRLIS